MHGHVRAGSLWPPSWVIDEAIVHIYSPRTKERGHRVTGKRQTGNNGAKQVLESQMLLNRRGFGNKGSFWGRAWPERSQASRAASDVWERAWEDGTATMWPDKGRRRVLSHQTSGRGWFLPPLLALQNVPFRTELLISEGSRAKFALSSSEAPPSTPPLPD